MPSTVSSLALGMLQIGREQSGQSVPQSNGNRPGIDFVQRDLPRVGGACIDHSITAATNRFMAWLVGDFLPGFHPRIRALL